MKKGVLLVLLLLIGFNKTVYADGYCTESSAKQVAKILYHEVGGTVNTDSSEDFFVKLVTASIIVNNAYNKSGNSFTDKLYNLTDSNYDGYSSYKNSAFENVVSSSEQGKMLYIAELVLTGKFSVPKEMHLQASKSIVERYGTVWTSTPANNGGIDVYFGYEGNMSDKDIYGNTLPSTVPSYYRSLASNLMQSSYASYTVSDVCTHTNLGNNSGQTTPSNNNNNNNGNSNNNNNNTYTQPSNGNNSNQGGSNNDGNSGSTNIPSTQPSLPTNSGYQANPSNSYANYDLDLCHNPDVLRALFILKMVIQIIIIVVPATLVIMGILAYFKAVTGDGDMKEATNMLFKKIIVGALIAFIPSIVSAMLKSVNMNVKSFNYKECYNNANLKYIKQAEAKK